MAKKASASSQPVKQKMLSESDILMLRDTDQYKRETGRLLTLKDEDIDTGVMPELTPKQLAHMVRFADFRRQKKALVSVRIDERVLLWLKSKGEGHLTRINTILTRVMEAEQEVNRR